MLRTLALLVVYCLAALPARAEQVALQSGEHEGFTRLVLDFAAPVGWTMTRTDRGYRLALDRSDMRFDLTGVFRLIPRTRLATIWADPESGDLMLGVGCACHAIPFELRPDVLVIDLRDGSPPPGSSFEMAGNGQVMPPLEAHPASRPRLRPTTMERPGKAVAETAEGGYNWLDLALAPGGEPAAAEAGHAVAADLPAPADAPAPHGGDADAEGGARLAGAEALRSEILRQISDGAARGMVDLAPHVRRDEGGEEGGNAAAPLPQVRIGGEAGVDPAAADRPANRLTAEGERCLPDAAVDVTAWGAEGAVAETIADRTAHLYGEFDRVDVPEAGSAVRYLLHLGFGAEARVLIRNLPLEGPDADLWSALAAVVDGEPASPGPLAGMEVCDGAVALWSVLAQPDLSPGTSMQPGAVLRAFSALPPHLRRHLGPTLVARFVARGDERSVRAIRDAILRPGGDPGPGVQLMEAELGTAGEHDTEALIALQSAPGVTGAEATVAAVTAIVADGGTVDVAMTTSLEALLREYKGADKEPDLRRALALARATQGDFDGAFGILPEADAARADLWAMLADRGTEGAVMTHALRGGVAAIPPVPPVVGQRIARRLIDAHFPDAAIEWLDAAPPAEGEARERTLLLAAEAELARRDARAAVALLAGIGGEEAAALRNAALLQLGTAEPLARVRDDAAASEDQRAEAGRRAGDWTSVASGGPQVWRDAAALAAGVPDAPDAPPLARARALVDESARAREALSRLMEATLPPPDTAPGAAPGDPPAEGGT